MTDTVFGGGDVVICVTVLSGAGGAEAVMGSLLTLGNASAGFPVVTAGIEGWSTRR